MTADHEARPARRLDGVTAVVVGTILLSGFVLALALEEEPYHIDELRQTRSYTYALGEVADRSFAQDQPPLDPITNALAQRILGQGDWQQRLLSALFAVGGYAFFAILGYRSGFRFGVGSGILILALSPLLISVFAYARPYALPFFLMMAFAWSTDHWLRRRRLWAGAITIVTALLLPLSRTIEPNIVLASAVLVLVALRFKRGKDWSVGSIWLPVSAAVIGLGVVGVPVLLRLRSQLTGYTTGGFLPTSQQLSRLVSDVPDGLTRTIPAWPAALAVALAAILVKQVRQRIAQTWWFWIVVIVPVAFISLFVAVTDPGQPLANRYFFTWVPLIAFMVTAVVDEVFRARRPSLVLLAGGVGSLALVLAFAAASIVAFSTSSRGDWEALSDTIESVTTEETVVVFESVRPLGQYRTPYAGKPRYLDPIRSVPSTLEVIRNPNVITPETPVAIAIAGPEVSVSGWHRIKVDEYFALYISQSHVRGPISAAAALATFGRQYDLARGSAFLLAAASLYGENGFVGEACSILNEMESQPTIQSAVNDLMQTETSSAWSNEC